MAEGRSRRLDAAIMAVVHELELSDGYRRHRRGVDVTRRADMSRPTAAPALELDSNGTASPNAGSSTRPWATRYRYSISKPAPKSA